MHFSSALHEIASLGANAWPLLEALGAEAYAPQKAEAEAAEEAVPLSGWPLGALDEGAGQQAKSYPSVSSSTEAPETPDSPRNAPAVVDGAVSPSFAAAAADEEHTPPPPVAVAKAKGSVAPSPPPLIRHILGLTASLWQCVLPPPAASLAAAVGPTCGCGSGGGLAPSERVRVHSSTPSSSAASAHAVHGSGRPHTLPPLHQTPSPTTATAAPAVGAVAAAGLSPSSVAAAKGRAPSAGAALKYIFLGRHAPLAAAAGGAGVGGSGGGHNQTYPNPTTGGVVLGAGGGLGGGGLGFLGVATASEGAAATPSAERLGPLASGSPVAGTPARVLRPLRYQHLWTAEGAEAAAAPASEHERPPVE